MKSTEVRILAALYIMSSVDSILSHECPVLTICGFIAQLARAMHRHREATSSNLVEVLTVRLITSLNIYIRRLFVCHMQIKQITALKTV